MTTVANTYAKSWEVHWSNSRLNSPAVANGYVYFKMDHIICFNAFTGETIWESTKEVAQDIWSVVVANGYVYADSNGYVYALNTSTGEEIWTYVIGNDEELYAPAVANGVVYVGSGDNNLYAFDAYTGTKIWNYTTGGKVRSSPAVINGIVYVGANDGNLYAIDASTGVKIWNYTTGKKVQHAFGSSLAVADDVVYVGSNNKIVYALNALTGSKIWSSMIGHMFSTPAVAYGYIYVADHNNLYAFNASTGTKIWNFTHYPGLFPEYSSPTVANGVVYIGSGGNDSYSGRLYALNAYTGDLIKQIEMSSKVFSTPAVAYNMVYVASAHKLHAIDVSSLTTSLVSDLPFTLIVIVVVVVILAVVIFVYKKKRTKKQSTHLGDQIGSDRIKYSPPAV